MKKSLLFLCVLAFVSFTANAKDYDWKETKNCEQTSELKCDLSGNPITGKVIVNSRDGSVRVNEYNYKNGKKDGIQQMRHENGNLAWEINYKDGIPDGISKMYYEDGKLQEDTEYQNGKIVSQKVFFKNGSLFALIEGSIADNLEGGLKFYYETGELKLESTRKNNGLDGQTTIYRKNGKPKYKITIKNGKDFSGYSYDKNNVKKAMSEEKIKKVLTKYGEEYSSTLDSILN